MSGLISTVLERVRRTWTRVELVPYAYGWVLTVGEAVFGESHHPEADYSYTEHVFEGADLLAVLLRALPELDEGDAPNAT